MKTVRRGAFAGSMVLAAALLTAREAHAQSGGATVEIGEVGGEVGTAPAAVASVRIQGTGVVLDTPGSAPRVLDVGCTVRAATVFGAQVYVACDGGVVRIYGPSTGNAYVLVSERRVGAEVRGLFVVNNRVWLEYARVEAQPVEMLPVASAGIATGTVQPSRTTSGAAVLAADVEPAVRGRVLAVHGTIVQVSIGRNQGVANGQRLEIGSTGGDDDTNVAATVVGEVRAVGSARAEVEIGFGERVNVGDRVRATTRTSTASLVAPPRSAPILSFGGSIRLLVPISNLGVGMLDDLWATWHATAPFALRARFFPLGLLYIGNSSYGSTGTSGLFGAALEAMFDSRFFAIGLGLGTNQYQGYSYFGSPSAQFGFAITQTLRVGTLDGLNMTVQTQILVANNAFQFGGGDGGFQIPLTRTMWLVIRGGGTAGPLGWTDVGMRIATQGSGRGGTLFITPTLGWAGMSVDYGFRAGPTAGIGLEYRVGL